MFGVLADIILIRTCIVCYQYLLLWCLFIDPDLQPDEHKNSHVCGLFVCADICECSC